QRFHHQPASVSTSPCPPKTLSHRLSLALSILKDVLRRSSATFRLRPYVNHVPLTTQHLTKTHESTHPVNSSKACPIHQTALESFLSSQKSSILPLPAFALDNELRCNLQEPAS